MTTLSVCLLPKLEGTGGPSIFQTNLCRGLEKHGISVHHNPDCTDINAILVIGGTNQLISLWRVKKRGIRIIKHMDGGDYSIASDLIEHHNAVSLLPARLKYSGKNQLIN